MIEQLLSPDLVRAIGWTLVHSLWQAAIFALLLGLLLVGLRKYSARARYNVAIATLATFFFAVLLTFGGLYGRAGRGVAASSPSPALLSGVSPMATPLSTDLGVPGAMAEPAVVLTERPSFRQRVTAYYNEHLPLIVTLWLMGVLILQLRFLGQLAYLQRLKNYGAERFPLKLAPLLQELETAIGISKPVRYLTSFRVASPFTSGWWRPVVFFPASLLAELNEPELRTIIAHELAHVKRHDFLVNLAQTLVCILFFYHPAVWWMSARVEEEREHCCDDLAIAVTGERVGYARTLVQLKEREAGPAMAMGFLGRGGFKLRVTRLLSGYLGTGTYGEGFTSAVIIAGIMAVAVSLSGQQDTASDLLAKAWEPTLEQRTLPVAKPAAPAPPPRPEPPFGQASTSRQPEDLDPDMSDSTAFLFFLEAIDDGNEALTRYFIEQGVDVNAVDRHGWTPLMVAASENQAEILSLLIAAGADVNFVNHDGWSALIEAADEGATECVRLLLQAGAKPDLSGTPRSALAMAASEGHAELITILVAAGANIASLEGGGAPLHEAAEEGQLHIVKALINKGADAGARGEDGRTALSYAAEEGQLEVVRYLLTQGGANPNDSDDNRRTALSYAAEEAHPAVVELLLAAGATPMIKDLSGRTALDYALEELGSSSLYWKHDEWGSRPLSADSRGYDFDHPLKDVIYALVAAGATNPGLTIDENGIIILSGKARAWREDHSHDFESDDHYGGPLDGDDDHSRSAGLRRITENRVEATVSGEADPSSEALVEAVTEGRNIRIDQLIERGDNLDGIASNGRTPLTEASFRNYNIHSEQLIRGGADINKVDAEGYTPLTMAATHNHTSTLDLLLRMGANPDLKDGKGRSAKTIALRDGSAQMLRLLNHKGASVTSFDDGRNPLTTVARDGYVEVVKFLLDEGVNPNAGEGCSPLFLAARERETVVVKLLTDNKADTESRCDFRDTDHYYRPVPGGGGVLSLYEGATPLMMAITQVDTKTAMVLISAGANVNARCRKYSFSSPKPIDGELSSRMDARELKRLYDLNFNLSGWTPLMEAVQTSKPEIVSLLLKAGADKSITLTGGVTALSLARELGNEEIIQLISGS